jgi:DNA-binding NarL/FixJ family response regulator
VHVSANLDRAGTVLDGPATLLSAAGGATNNQIAAALSISPKTVEANLSRAYAKLRISSRAELGAWMATQRRGQEPSA